MPAHFPSGCTYPPVINDADFSQLAKQVRVFVFTVSGLGGVPREQKMLKGHLPRVIYLQVYLYKKMSSNGFQNWIDLNP